MDYGWGSARGVTAEESWMRTARYSTVGCNSAVRDQPCYAVYALREIERRSKAGLFCWTETWTLDKARTAWNSAASIPSTPSGPSTSQSMHRGDSESADADRGGSRGLNGAPKRSRNSRSNQLNYDSAGSGLQPSYNMMSSPSSVSPGPRLRLHFLLSDSPESATCSTLLPTSLSDRCRCRSSRCSFCTVYRASRVARKNNQ